MSAGKSDSDPLRTENAEGATFTERTRAIVVALGTVSLVATIVILVFGRSLAPPPAQPRDSYGRGPLGHRAWVETMQALGVHVVRWTQPDYDSVTAPLFLIEPDAASIEAPDGRTVTIADLCRERAAAGRLTVIVLPKWKLGALGDVAPEQTWRVEELLAGTPFESAQLVWQPGVTADRTIIAATSPRLGARTLEIPWPQTVAGATPVVTGPTGSFVLASPDERTFLVSDPDLLHNFDVQRADHAALTYDFVTMILHADTIVVDEVFHEHVETRSLAQLFARFPGVLALVHGGLVVLVVLLYGRRRFGPPRAEPMVYGRGPREIIEVAAGVLAAGQSIDRLAPRYVEQVLLDAHRRLGLTEGKTLAQKAAALDARLVRRGLAPDAVRLLETSHRATRDTALALAARAARLRESLLGVKAAEGPPRRAAPSPATELPRAASPASSAPPESENRP